MVCIRASFSVIIIFNLNQGGKASRVVNCVLALKSYSEWKQAGGNGSWKLSGNVKPTSFGKQFFMRNSEPFMNSISRSASIVERALVSGDLGCDNSETVSWAILLR